MGIRMQERFIPLDAAQTPELAVRILEDDI
jgi:hypothetical protein